MRAHKTEKGYLLRFEKGEELVLGLETFCNNNDIRSGAITAIGSCTHAELGCYVLDEKQFYWKSFDGAFEFASLSGNISRFQGEPVVHIHAVIADKECHTYGGHLKHATIGATCELFLTTGDESLDRVFDEATGLNLWKI